MTQVDITGLGREQAYLTLVPYMAHPNDDDARARYTSFLSAKRHFDEESAIESSRSVLRHLVEAAELGVGGDLARSVSPGRMAGATLLARLRLHSADPRDAGLDKAQHVASEYYNSIYRKGKSSPAKIGRDTIRKNWTVYGVVAHLWAATMILLAESKVQNDDELLRDGHHLASIAMGLMELATNAKQARNTAPILPIDALEIKGAVPTQLIALALPDDFIAAGETFESRKRYP